MTAGSQKRSLFPWILTTAVIAAAGWGIWYYLGGEQEATYSYETTTVDTGLIEQSVSATGTVQALITVDLSSQLSGQIADVEVDYNSKVKAGDLLAVLDKKTFAAKVKSAEANLAMALAGVVVQEATIKKSQALFDKAKDDLDRQERLNERGAVSETTLKTAITTVATSEADLSVATAQLENAKALVEQRRSDLQQAQIDLQRTEIRSPIDAVVIARNIDPGATVAASLSAPILFQIAQDLSKIQIETLVDEADIGRIKAGNDVTFTVDAYPEQTFRGKVEQVRIGGTNENNVVTYSVIVRADNPREKLLPGMTATVRIVTGRKTDVLRVSNAAIRFTPPSGTPGAKTAPRWGRSEAFREELAELLNLTEEQQGKLKSELEELRARRINAQSIEGNDGKANGSERSGNKERRQNSEGRTGRPNSSRSERGQGNLSRILRGIMTEEQAAVYKKWRDERRETTRPAVVWLNDGQKLVPRKIRLGLSDEANAEIVGGVLKKGDKVVTRARSSAQKSRRSAR